MSGDAARSDDPQVVVDARGKPCPMPVIELANAVKDAASGAVVEVLSDDLASKVDVPVWCRMQGHDYLGHADAEGGGVSYHVRKA